MNAEGRDPRFDPNLRKRAKKLYESGLTVREVAEKMGVHRNRVSVLLQEADVQMRRRGPRTDKKKGK